MDERPPIVCLCGSTRFKPTWERETKRLTLAGFIVLGVGSYPHYGHDLTLEEKARMDELHKRKIDLADSVFVLDVDGYIGESTRSEIEYAEAHGKPVHYLSKRQEDSMIQGGNR